MKKARKEVEPYNLWSDETAPEQSFTHEEMMKRLKEVHGIDPATTKGQRSMMSHIDGDTWFTYNYQWTIGGKKFYQSIRQLRRGSNRAIWARGE